MPDVRTEVGVPTGTVVASENAVIPSTLGTDIGGGMVYFETPYKAASFTPKDLEAVKSRIEKAVPYGRTDNGGIGDKGAWGDTVEPKWNFPSFVYDELDQEYKELLAAFPELKTHRHFSRHLGTLGAGKHFIEVAENQKGLVCIIVHSGSRGPGNRIGQYFIDQAKTLVQKNCTAAYLPNLDLAFLTEANSDLFTGYLRAVKWSQAFAKSNRYQIASTVLNALCNEGDISATMIDCHHNSLEREHHGGKTVWVARKGAIRARREDWGVIAGGKDGQTRVVRGRGCADSFMSSGADHANDRVIEAQAELVDVVGTMKQLICVKG